MHTSNSFLSLTCVCIVACGSRAKYGDPLDNGHADPLYFGNKHRYTLRGPKDVRYRIDVPLALCPGNTMALRFSPRIGGIEVMEAALTCPTNNEIKEETNEQHWAILEAQKQGLVAALESAGFVVEATQDNYFGQVHIRFRRTQWYGEIYFVAGWRWEWAAYFAIVQRAKVEGKPQCWDPRTKTMPRYADPRHAPTLFARDCE